MGMALSRQCSCVDCIGTQQMCDWISRRAHHGHSVTQLAQRSNKRAKRDKIRYGQGIIRPEFPDEVDDGDLLDSVPTCLLMRRPSGPSKLVDLPPELLDMIAANLSLEDIKSCRLVSKAVGFNLLYMLADSCPQGRHYQQITPGVNWLTRCHAFELRRTVRELSLMSANPTVMMPPSIKDLDLPRLAKLDLQGVRFAPHNNLKAFLERHLNLRELRLCFVSLLRFEWWSEVLRLLRDDFHLLEKLTAVCLRYARIDSENKWLILPNSNPERCEDCSSSKTYHKQVIDLRRHPATNCEHTQTFHGRTNVQLALDDFFDAGGKLEKPEVNRPNVWETPREPHLAQHSKQTLLSQTQRPMQDQWYELLGSPT